MSEEQQVNEQVNETERLDPNAEVVIDVEGEAVETEGEERKSTSESLREAWKQVESFGQALSNALQGRGNVITLRVNDEALRHLDMLVEAEITKSRSESAAFLINEGIHANQELFDRISTITQQIVALREQLRAEVQKGLPK